LRYTYFLPIRAISKSCSITLKRPVKVDAAMAEGR
jgi:hypothetical protein